MVAEKRLETLQEEIKLLKGELKHSLASVRDYLLNSELPSADLSNLSCFYGEGEQKISMKSITDSNNAATAGALANDVMDLSDAAVEEPDMPLDDEDLIDLAPETHEDKPASEEPETSQETITDPYEEPFTNEEEPIVEEEVEEEPVNPRAATLGETLPEEVIEEEVPLDYERTVDAVPTTPKVNMLANLITWVARAKKDIGYEQLPVFLEVYGLSGHLSLELKEAILHFAEITAERPDVPGDAETWSQAMLTLHGILTGGDAPLHPVIPSWAQPSAEELIVEEDELIEVNRPPETPMKLKLVLPGVDGQSKEFCIDLTPETDNGKQPKKDKKKKSS